MTFPEGIVAVAKLGLRARSYQNEHHLNRGVFRALVVLGIAAGFLRADSFTVTSVNPPDGSLIQPFASVTANFSQDVNPASLSGSDLTVNGVNGTGFTMVTSEQVTFFVNPASIPSGNRVPNTVDISGIADLAATSLVPYTESVFTDNVPPAVVSGSISNGEIVGPGALTEVVTFSEPMNTGLTTASGIDLRGLLLAVNYAPASFSWDATGTILTVNYSALPVDDYAETLVASDFADIVGLNLTSNYVVDFCASSNGSCAPLPAVPEPSSLTLFFGVCVVVVASLRRRKA